MQCEPVYESLPGWEEELQQVREYEDLPRTARAYLERVAQALAVPIALVSVGPTPEETIETGF